MRKTDVVIVGAGPYGLSIAAHLRPRGVNFEIFGEPMQSWRERMPAGMLLKSDAFASNLSDPTSKFSLEAFQRLNDAPYRDTGWKVPLDTFVEYGRWFQTEVVPQLDRRDVSLVEAADGGFRLTLNDGEALEARRVVVAAGVRDFAYTPPQLADLPSHLVSHSSCVAEPERFKGQEVAVLGSGSSAIDLAILLHEAGASPRLIARASQLFIYDGDQGARSFLARLRQPTACVGPGWLKVAICETPDLFALLPQRVRVETVRNKLGPAAHHPRERIEGKLPINLSCRLQDVRVRGERLELELASPGGPQTVEADHLIAATGYKPDLDRLGFLAPLAARVARCEEAPELRADFQSSVPGLYFVGLAAAYRFGPVQRFVYGAHFAAKTLARRLAG